MATEQRTIEVHVCDLCRKDDNVRPCAHCGKDVCGECGWNIKCGPFGFLLSARGVVCQSCLSYLKQLLEAFGLTLITSSE